MNVEYLKKDELEVECIIRGLTLDAITQLKEQIELEESSAALVPKSPHLPSCGNPKKELQLCGVKLNSVKEWMQSNSECEDVVIKIKVMTSSY